MLWLLRTIFKLIMLVTILAILAVAGVVLFVSPDNFKKEINEYLQSYTGYAFEIKGPILWSFKPQMAFHIQDISLASPSGFKAALVEAKEAHIYVDPYTTLFGDTLVVNKLEIKNLTINVEQQNNGTSNLSNIPASSATSTRKVIVKEVMLQSASINFQDDQDNKHWALNNANVSTKNLTLNPINKIDAIPLKGDLTNLDANLTFNLDTVLNVDLDKQTLSFDPLTICLDDAKLTGKSVISQYMTTPAVTGELALDALDLSSAVKKLMPDLSAEMSDSIGKIGFQISFNYISQSQFLEFPNLNIQVDDGAITGDCKMTLASPYKANFNLNADHISLQPLLNVAMTFMPAPTEEAPSSLIPVNLLNTISIDGKLSGSAVKLGSDFLIDHITVDVSAQSGILQLNPITLSAYEGGHNCSIELDVTKATPALKIVEQASNVSLEQWSKLFNMPIMILGNAEAKISLDATGASLEGFKQTIDGGINLMMKKGSLLGIDMDKLLEYSGTAIGDAYGQLAANKGSDLSAMTKLKANDWISTQKSNPSTAFDGMELKVELKQGTSNASITMTGTNYDLKGNGGFELATDKVNFNLLVTNKAPTAAALPEIAAYVKQTQLQIAVSGSPEKLIFTPDLQNYFTTGIKQTQNSVMKRAVNKMVSSAGPSAKTSKTAAELFADSLKGLAK